MAQPQPYPPGARRVDRPAEVVPCSNCGELLGRGYPDCAICAERIDDLWWADWRALLDSSRIRPGSEYERELAARVLSEEVGQHPWTCTDWALWLTPCGECDGQLGSGSTACVTCAAADASRWAWDFQAMPDSMTYNEHLLRVAVAGLRAPHRHRATVVTGWRLTLPFLLLGKVPSPRAAARIRAAVLAGRHDELARAESLCAMAALPDLPWRS